MYKDGEKCVGTICAVGAFDSLNGKTVLRVNVKGEHGVLPGVLWLDPNDGKTVNGNKLPSSMERAKSLCEYLTGKSFTPGNAPAMAQSTKTVTFTASKRITDSGNEVYDARFIGVPQGLAAFNAPSAEALAKLFGTSVEATSAAPTEAPKGEHQAPPGDEDIPF